MLESLAFALVKTFITFMFQQNLEHMQAVHIQGAPSWYYQQTSEHICDSGFAYGRLEAVDAAKAEARKQMVLRRGTPWNPWSTTTFVTRPTRPSAP